MLITDKINAHLTDNSVLVIDNINKKFNENEIIENVQTLDKINEPNEPELNETEKGIIYVFIYKLCF